MKRIAMSCLSIVSFVVCAPLLTQNDFARARSFEQKGRTVLQLTLTQEGASKLKEYSKAHVGEELPILVDGKLIGSPVIRVPIEGSSLQIDAFSRDQAAQLVKSIGPGK